MKKTNLIFLSVMCMALISCTSNNTVQQTLSPAPVATTQTAASNATATNQTALAAPSSTTPAQNVVDQQLSDGTQSQVTQVAALDPNKSLSFLPVEGMPQSAVSNFSESIKQSAQVHGLNLIPANQPTGKYRVKGYFSALNDGTGTLVTYIWDVVDTSGKRIHRINGQERNGSSSINPWSTVTQDQLRNVADTTASRLKSWLDSRS